jgi:hypothetical protein
VAIQRSSSGRFDDDSIHLHGQWKLDVTAWSYEKFARFFRVFDGFVSAAKWEGIR